ncbi:MAG: VRR-NUC domain-containing protein [Firmicutes bacterium]|nr:VRR-NUC domain-containing protein [Bacillota bacterium]
MKLKVTESQIQIMIFDWASMMRNKYPGLEKMYHVPNGGHRHITTAMRLKAEGVKPGVPDIVLPVARGGFHGLYLELKADKGKLSKEQEKWLTDLKDEGYKAEVAYGFDEAIKTITNYLKLI